MDRKNEKIDGWLVGWIEKIKMDGWKDKKNN